MAAWEWIYTWAQLGRAVQHVSGERNARVSSKVTLHTVLPAEDIYMEFEGSVVGNATYESLHVNGWPMWRLLVQTSSSLLVI